MFAYCYDLRVTEGESTVESPWTISKLSPTLSALEVSHRRLHVRILLTYFRHLRR
jgi:hypothetical protein